MRNFGKPRSENLRDAQKRFRLLQMVKSKVFVLLHAKEGELTEKGTTILFTTIA
ncbi:hypothetical protein IC620_10290 [Hazenella sp. IB182357]|uniref:Uncharacterized protein n=1 Tax=Polycladospora coralii TaxID=2771432 RepID=A0A926NBJ3_9BACL|nr:hypothetical protein [Polycladospora coralii]MBD1372745.1 hypothetical protein [Polycladospora coralii]